MGRTREGELTAMQQRFVEEYMVDMNAAGAMKRIGYKGNGADARGSQMLSIVKVRQKIDALKLKRAANTEVNSEWVLNMATKLLQELYETNRADISQLYDNNGNLKPIHTWPAVFRQKQNLKSMEVFEEFEKDRKGKKIFKGFFKKVTSTDHKNIEAQLLKIIGEHSKVGAFIPPRTNTDPPSTNVTVNVDAVDLSKLSNEELKLYLTLRKKATSTAA